MCRSERCEKKRLWPMAYSTIKDNPVRFLFVS
jgi:hypothetical protein